MEFLTNPNFREMFGYLIMFLIMMTAGLSPLIVILMIMAWMEG